MTHINKICLSLLLITTVSGCSSIGFYSQAVSGQISLMLARQPIDRMLADDNIEPGLRKKLTTAVAVREFARDTLALPVEGSFRHFVELDRPWVVVNVMAAPEFSLQPHQWCYPVVGCQSFRGYFDLEQARDEQARLRRQGLDTFIGAVTAYSTLGWFDDPLHSGFTALPDDRMAALIIHELSHQVLYIAGDTAFNESFATAVELEGLKLWLAARGESAGFDAALARLERRRQTHALVAATVARLDPLYKRINDRNRDQLRQRKAQILQQFQHDYQALAADWQGPGPLGADAEPLNNARLALFRQYHQYVPGFRRMLRQLDHDFPAFYEAVKELAGLPPQQRQAVLLGAPKPARSD